MTLRRSHASVGLLLLFTACAGTQERENIQASDYIVRDGRKYKILEVLERGTTEVKVVERKGLIVSRVDVGRSSMSADLQTEKICAEISRDKMKVKWAPRYDSHGYEYINWGETTLGDEQVMVDERVIAKAPCGHEEIASTNGKAQLTFKSTEGNQFGPREGEFKSRGRVQFPLGPLTRTILLKGGTVFVVADGYGEASINLPAGAESSAVPVAEDRENLAVPTGGAGLLPPPPTGMKNPNAVAVVIGNRDYKAAASVEFALNDSQAMRAYLTDTLGYRPENILYEENATKGTLEALFGTESDPKGKLLNYLRPGKSDVFIYYSGHGAPDVGSREAYLVPVDAEPDYVSQTGYPLSRLYRNLAKMPARSVTVVVDACFSGESDAGMILRGVSPMVTRVDMPIAASSNSSVFTATAGDQVAVWYPDRRHGLFTYYFLKGIAGEADQDKSGKLSIGELQAYLEEKIPYMARRLKGREQTPVYHGSKRNRVIVKYK